MTLSSDQPFQQPSLFDGGGSDGREVVRFYPSFSGWRVAARRALERHRPPEDLWWAEDRSAVVDPGGTSEARVPRAFVDCARVVACHRSPDRWSLLYQILWRLLHEEPYLLDMRGDAAIGRLHSYDRSVRRDLHKMKAFVRFKQVQTEDAIDRYVAWFEPEHHIVELAAAFFRKRFTTMRWSVLTPLGCAHWEGQGELWYTEGLPEAVVLEDQMDRLWQTYYRSIFNPARVKENAMRAEMPQKYWKHLPEAQLIPTLMLEADQRVSQMLEATANPGELNCGERPVPYDAQLKEIRASTAAGTPEHLRAAIHSCRNCSLWAPATQAVPGEGPDKADIMIIGEQPGDQEDLAGKPFTGPAGQLLDQVLKSLGVDRESLYVTNAVKHFKFKATPKRRLHERPKAGEIDACRPWLLQEIANVSPRLIICLGATAVRPCAAGP